MLVKEVEKLESLHTVGGLVGMQNGAPAMENSMEGPQKIRNRTTI